MPSIRSAFISLSMSTAMLRYVNYVFGWISFERSERILFFRKFLRCLSLELMLIEIRAQLEVNFLGVSM